MAKTAFLCVGEGVQRIGMGVDMVPLSPGAADLFTEASDASGLEVFDLCTQGPQSELDTVQVAYPCLATTSLAIAAALREHGVAPDCVAGVGPGEYAAHVIAETVDAETALQLVSRCGAMLAMARNRGEEGSAFAARNMILAFKNTIFMEPKIDLYCSATGEKLVVKEVNDALMAQIERQPEIDACIRSMIEDGTERFIECGPGRVLSDTVRRLAAEMDVQVEVVSIGDALDFGLFVG